MTIKPVGHTPAPGYPDKYAGESRRALAAATPRRWIAAPVAAGLAAMVALGLSGCDSATAGVPEQIPMPETNVDYTTLGEPTQVPTHAEEDISPFTTLGIPMQVPTELQTRPVAAGTGIPLFEFGTGSGAFGCVMVTAPVFMSEEEAFAILSAAFAEAGLELRPDTKALKNAALPAAKIYASSDGDGKLKTKRGDLVPDGRLAELPVEFVSVDDVQAWHADTGQWSSVTLYPVKQSAKLLAEKNPGLVVFYDPIGSADYESLWNMEQKNGESDEAYWARREAVRNKLDQDARAESERLLREQAAAFLCWLSAEGASS